MTSFSKPTLSCCLVAYNEEELLPRQLKAIEEQDMPPNEIVLLDDGSTDKTFEVMHRFADRYPGRLKLARNMSPSGPPKAFNQAVKLAGGSWVYCASANDCLKPDAFSLWFLQTQFFPQECMIVGDLGWSTEPSHFDSWEAHRAIKEIDGIRGDAVFIKKATYQYYGGFIPELRGYSDVFLYHIAALKHGCVHIPYAITDMAPYQYSQSGTEEENREIVKEVKRILQSPEYDDIRDLCYEWVAWQNWLGLKKEVIHV